MSGDAASGHPYPRLTAARAGGAVLVTGAGLAAGSIFASRIAPDGSEVLLVCGALLAGYFLRPVAAWFSLVATAAGYTVTGVVVAGAAGVARAAYLVAASVAVLLIVSSLRTRLAVLTAGSSPASRSDALTGLPNRRAFDELLAHEMARCLRSGQPLAMLLAEIDRVGGGSGQVELREASQVLRSQMRDSDVLARVEGERFGILLPSCGADDAVRRAEHIRSLLERTAAGWSEPVTASIGAATAPTPAGTLDELLAAATAALQAARASGNRVVLAGNGTGWDADEAA